jgi:prophage DNA circulation protein
MSGLTGIVGLPSPTSPASVLQVASFRGVPFLVDASAVRVGRRQAVHQYPKKDGGWPEDMGRAQRIYSFTAHVVGDLAPVLQLALMTVFELEDSGLLIHPTIGAVQVGVLSAGLAIRKEAGREVLLELSFIEDSGTVWPTALIATAVSVVLLATASLSAANADLSSDAGTAAAAGPEVQAEGQRVVQAFGALVVAAGSDATAIVGMATALPPPDANTTYGRYAAGAAAVALPVGTTVATLQAQLASQRQALSQAAQVAAAAAAGFVAGTDMLDPLATLLEALRGGITNPADQIRLLIALAAFAFMDSAGGTVGISTDTATLRDAMSAACRRAALASLARAEAAYQPISYDDAVSVMDQVSAAIETELTTAADAGDDATYQALRQMRAGVIQDMTSRGANLPSVVTVNFPVSLPSLAIAQFLYRDASRADQIAAEAGAIHPAFCPVSFQALAS